MAYARNQQLSAPRVLEASLLPSSALNGVTVQLPEGLELAPDDEVTVWFSDLRTFTLESGMQSVHIPPKAIAELIGTQIEVYYVIHRSGVELPSHKQVLKLEGLEPGEPMLRAIFVDKAVNGVIDMDTFDGDATVTVPAAPFSGLGLRTIIVDVAGIGMDEFPILEQLDYLVVHDEADTVIPFPRELLSRFKPDSKMFIDARMNFGMRDGDPPMFSYPRAEYRMADGAVAGTRAS